MVLCGIHKTIVFYFFFSGTQIRKGYYFKFLLSVCGIHHAFRHDIWCRRYIRRYEKPEYPIRTVSDQLGTTEMKQLLFW